MELVWHSISQELPEQSLATNILIAGPSLHPTTGHFNGVHFLSHNHDYVMNVTKWAYIPNPD
jgi:hypothetical protein